MKIQPATEPDFSAVLELNEAAAPHVNSIPLATLRDLAGDAAYFRVARDGDRLAGFLLALGEDATYDSPNFLWFRDRYRSFVYVDRVVVSASHRRTGVGLALYEDLVQTVGERARRVTCEVNVEPPNPGSLVFHRGLGFVEVGRQRTDGGDKLVSLMEMDLVENRRKA